MAHLDSRAQAQSLQWQEGINNPRGYSVEEVITNRELFRLFIGEHGPELTDDLWEEGVLSLRSARIKILRDQGWIK